ncbi:MAG: arginase [Planctomycetota bacterium]|nr:arginase [Planctomycetota bacterium]
MDPKPIDLVGVPVDLGVKELGLKLGPDALREAGLVSAAGSVGLEVRDLGNLEMPPPSAAADSNGRHTGLIAAWCEALRDAVARSIREGRMPISMGGDHSLAIGSMAGAAVAVGRLGCIWLDAHPDANTPQTSPSGNIHGMPVAVAVGHGLSRLVTVAGPKPAVSANHMALLGVRDADVGELEFIRQHNIRMFTVFDVLEHGLPSLIEQIIERAAIGTDGVHVSLDLDVLHEDIAPGVGLPSSCGFDMREATYICRRIAEECEVTSIDVVGLNPVRDRNMRTARLAIELLMVLLGRSYSFSYSRYLENQTH